MVHEDVPVSEKPFQRKRRLLVGMSTLGLLLLSIGLELHQRAVDPAQVLNGTATVAKSLIDPDTLLPAIDLLANLRGILAILRNLVPSVVMFMLMLWFGERFVQAMYGLASRNEASAYLRNSLFGAILGRGPLLAKVLTTTTVERVFSQLIKATPFVIVAEGKILGGEYQPPVRVGGPATLIVRNDSAVLLERAGQLTRTLGPGFHTLRRFEKVRQIIDLRPYRYRHSVTGMSREGLEVTWEIDVQLAISDEGRGRHEATEQHPFSYSDEALLKAANHNWVRNPENNDIVDWRTRVVVAEAEPTLIEIIADNTVNVLIEPNANLIDLLVQHFSDPKDVQDLCQTLGIDNTDLPETETAYTLRRLVKDLENQNRVPDLIALVKVRKPDVPWVEESALRRIIQRDLEAALKKHAAKHGAKVLAVALNNVTLAQPVTEQRLRYWEAKRDRERTLAFAPAHAERTRLEQRLRAQATQEMIAAIVEGFRDIQDDEKRRTVSNDVVLLRFIEIMGQIRPRTGFYPPTLYPDQALDTLDKLRELLR